MTQRRQGRLVIVSILLIIGSFLLKEWSSLAFLSDGLMIVAALVAGISIFIKAVQGLRYKVVGIELLVTIAVTGALVIGEYWEAAAVTLLFVIGGYLETRTIEKTRSSIESLLKLAPTTAAVIRAGVELSVDPEEVEIGEVVLVRAGQKIPVDGRIIRGNASINQAAITGESIPVSKKELDEVFSGTMNETGYIEIETLRTGEDTTLAKIIEMVEEAQEHKAKTQKFLERFASYYTPMILILAVLSYIVTLDIRLTLTLLVISCPGALVISVPVSIVAGIGNSAKYGVLIKGGEFVETLANLDIIAFDKTGTLTKGSPAVTKIHAYSLKEEELLRLAASAEKGSDHPLAKAILSEASTRGITSFLKVEEFVDSTGTGVTATFLTEKVNIGNRKHMELNGIEVSEEIQQEITKEEEDGQTVVIVSKQSEVVGLIAIADEIREEAYELVRSLKKAGIKKTVMLTGDNIRTANAVGKKLGIDIVYGEQLPKDKVAAIKQLQQDGSRVAMVGDGINDSPALATADTSIAMGAAGSDVAMETADVVLMNDNLLRIPYILGLSRFTVNNMKQNIIISISVVLLLILGVLLKKVFMTSGMLIHEISVLVVIMNALRVVRFKNKFKSQTINTRKGVWQIEYSATKV